MQASFVCARRVLARGLLLSPLAWAMSSSAWADTWPASPIRIVVNNPAGGAVDVVARLVATPLAKVLHQPVIIENRGGANGNIGAEAVARAPADGYTLLASAGGVFAVNTALYPNMSFNVERDLQPVAGIMRVSVFLTTNASVPVSNVREFVEWGRAHPGKLSFGSAGTGSLPHLAAEMFNEAAGIRSLHVPYRGAAPALADLLGGQVQYMFDPGIGLAQVRAGKLKRLAIADLKRSPLFPDLPTVAESGLPGFEANSWYGIYAPAGVPADIVDRLNKEINLILERPEVKEGLATLGGQPLAVKPAELKQKARADTERFGAVIRARDIRID